MDCGKPPHSKIQRGPAAKQWRGRRQDRWAIGAMLLPFHKMGRESSLCTSSPIPGRLEEAENNSSYFRGLKKKRYFGTEIRKQMATRPFTAPADHPFLIFPGVLMHL
jgi:hypothetical protein